MFTIHMMQLSITTDFVKETGSPEPFLRRIADAGFSHVHWCHQWWTDFFYSRPEIEQVRKWLSEYGLQLLDLHASAGVEKNWTSLIEYERLAGVELVRNRLEMTADLAGSAIVMHTRTPPAGQESLFWQQLRHSLDALESHARDRGVRIAIENGNWPIIETILAEYPPDYVGVCYDSGHGNRGQGSLRQLACAKDRLISIHLHDNDGLADQHNLLFTGTVDWGSLAHIIATSAYSKCASMEVSMRNSGIQGEVAFLAKAFETGIRFSRMIDEHRESP